MREDSSSARSNDPSTTSATNTGSKQARSIMNLWTAAT